MRCTSSSLNQVRSIRRAIRVTAVSAVVGLLLTSSCGVARASDPRFPLEPPDTSSPRDTLRSFVTACDEIYALIKARGGRRASTKESHVVVLRLFRCLDLSEQPAYMQQYAAGEATVCLKEVLDRMPLPAWEDVPDVSAMTGRKIPRWVVPHTEIAIVLIEEGPRRGEYLFSADTVARAATFYEHAKHLPYKEGASENFYEWFRSRPRSEWAAALVHRLPRWTQHRFWGQAVWQWVGLILTVLTALAVMFFAYRMGKGKAEEFRRSNLLRYWITIAYPVAAVLVPLWVKDFAADQLALSGRTLMVVRFAANFAFLLAVLVVLVGAGSRVAALIIASPRIHPKGIDAQLIRLGCRVASLVAAAVVFLEGGKYLGIPLTTLLAGAGVGGLAVALAAQDSLKNLFGSMMIILDKPYRVGERIALKGYDGVVEEIGLRSTKIRLLTGHQACIPNEEMARCDIENIGRRPYIRRVENIAVPFDTPPAKIEQAVEIVRKLLDNHEGMEPDFPPRVFFDKYNRDSANLKVIYWYHPPAYWDFLAFSERFNLQVIQRFEAAGIRFALPGTTTEWVARDPAPVGIDAAKSAAAADDAPPNDEP